MKWERIAFWCAVFMGLCLLTRPAWADGTSLTFNIPSEHNHTKYFTTLKQGVGASLSVTIVADPNCVIITNEPGTMPAGVTVAGK